VKTLDEYLADAECAHGHLCASLPRERCAELGLSPGRKCALQIPPAAIHVFPPG